MGTQDDSLGRAFELAFAAHRGQTDKLGEPYCTHLVRVADRLDEPTCQIVALLHDVVEDTATSLDDLARMFNPEIVAAVDALTKRSGEPYEAYLVRVIANPIAREVKKADLADNSDERRLSQLDAKTQKRLTEKYELAKAYLMKEEV